MEKLKQNKNLLVVAAIVGALLVVALAVFLFVGQKTIARNVMLTNVSDTATTVVWTTDSSAHGVVVVTKKDDKSGTVIKFNDDRDTEVNDKGERVLKSEGAKKYTSHHVTVSGLDPEATYEFKIESVELAKGGVYPAITTGPTLDTLVTPNPVYGKVVDPDGNALTDAVVTIELIGQDEKAYSLVGSAVVGANGTYSLDIANLRDASLAKTFKESQIEFERVKVVTAKEYTGGNLMVKSDLDQPVPDIKLENGTKDKGDSAMIEGNVLGEELMSKVDAATDSDCGTKKWCNWGDECKLIPKLNGCNQKEGDGCQIVSQALDGSDNQLWSDCSGDSLCKENKEYGLFFCGGKPSDQFIKDHPDTKPVDSGNRTEINDGEECSDEAGCICNGVDVATGKECQGSDDVVIIKGQLGKCTDATEGTKCCEKQIYKCDGKGCAITSDGDCGAQGLECWAGPSGTGEPNCQADDSKFEAIGGSSGYMGDGTYCVDGDKIYSCTKAGCETKFTACPAESPTCDQAKNPNAECIGVAGSADSLCADISLTKDNAFDNPFGSNQEPREIIPATTPKDFGANNSMAVAWIVPSGNKAVISQIRCVSKGTIEVISQDRIVDKQEDDLAKGEINNEQASAVVIGVSSDGQSECKVGEMVAAAGCCGVTATKVEAKESGTHWAACPTNKNQVELICSAGAWEEGSCIDKSSVCQPASILVPECGGEVRVNEEGRAAGAKGGASIINITCSNKATTRNWSVEFTCQMPGEDGATIPEWTQTDSDKLDSTSLGCQAKSLGNNASITKVLGTWTCDLQASGDPFMNTQITLDPATSKFEANVGSVIGTCAYSGDADTGVYLPEADKKFVCASGIQCSKKMDVVNILTVNCNTPAMLDGDINKAVLCTYNDSLGIGLTDGSKFFPAQVNTKVNCDNGVVTDSEGKTISMKGTLSSSLLSTANAQGSDIGFDGAGEYNVSLEGYTLTTDKIKIVEVGEDGLPVIEFFNDANKNGIKDEGEEVMDGIPTDRLKIVKESAGVGFNLTTGWNLLGMPMLPKDANERTAKGLIKAINDQGIVVTQIAKYSKGIWTTYSFRKDTGEEFGSDFQLIPGEAFFLRSYQKGNFLVVGNAYEESVPVDLANGWNLVNIISPKTVYTAESVIDTLTKQNMKADTVSKYESGLYTNVIKKEGTLYGNDYKIFDNAGYFIRIEDGAVKWTP